MLETDVIWMLSSVSALCNNVTISRPEEKGWSLELLRDRLLTFDVVDKGIVYQDAQRVYQFCHFMASLFYIKFSKVLLSLQRMETDNQYNCVHNINPV